MSETKQIKFQFVVDENSARAVNRVLDDMIKKAQELGKTMAAVGGQGIMGGAKIGSGAPSAQSTLAGKGGSGGKTTTSFTQILGGSADGFKKLASESGAAMKAMTDSLQRAASQQQRAVDKLAKELDGLAKMYDKVGGKASGAFGEKLQNLILKKGRETQSARGELSRLRQMEGEMLPGPREDVLPGNAPLSAMGKFRGFLNSGGGLGAQDVSMANLSKIPGIGPMFSGMGFGAGAATAGVGLIATIAVKAATQAASAAYNAPTISQNARLEAVGVGPSSYARKLRAGDLSDIRAQSEIANDQDKAREFKETAGEGGGFWNWTRRVGIGIDASKKAWGRGEFGAAASNLFSGTDSIDAQNVIKGKKREYLNKTIEERGVEEDIMRDATANAMGKMSTMRALGIGDGWKKGGRAYRSNSERFLLGFNQFDPGEVIAAMQGVAGAGSRGAAKANHSALLSAALQAQAGGINNAAGMGGIFSRQGAQQGTDFVNLVRTIAGRGGQGGTDVSVASLLGNVVAQKADQMNTGGFTGAGLLGQLSVGTQGPQGAMIARQNIQGQEEIQKMYAGSRDPAQYAQNLLIAKKAAPDAGFYAQQYLAKKLDASRIAEIQSGHFTLTPEEVNLGITPEMLRQTASGIKDTSKLRTVAGGFGATTEAGKFQAARASGMSALEYAQKTFMGDDGKWSDAEREKAVGVYATTLRAGNENLSLSAAMGQAREEMFGAGKRIKKGVMAGDVAGGSLESKIARDEAERRKVDVDLKDASMKKIEEEQTHTAEAYKRLVTNSSNLAITADNITAIIKGFASRLKAAADGGPTGANVRTTKVK